MDKAKLLLTYCFFFNYIHNDKLAAFNWSSKGLIETTNLSWPLNYLSKVKLDKLNFFFFF